MNTEDRGKWLELRRQGIGASEAGAVCGVSKWKSPYQVWLEKRGECGPQEDNEPLYWGRALEPIIRQRYADETGRTVKLVGTIQGTRLPFMFASPDGITDDNRLVEIKTSRSSEGWGEPGTDEIPDVYQCQVQHQMVVTGLIVADVPALIGGNDFRLYEVHADRELQELIMEKEAEFWEMVKRGTPPDPTTYADVKLRFGSKSSAAKVQASQEVIQAVLRLKQLKELTKEEEALKAVIMCALGDKDTLVDGDKTLCTWKAAKPTKRFDATAFKEANAALYEQYLKEGEPSRRLLLK